MKQSVHTQRGPRYGKGGYRPWHNDGSMYRSDTERFERCRKMNGHWDMYMYDGPYKEGQAFIGGGKQVGRTCAAVNQFYEEAARAEYNERCNSASWKKNPKRFKEFAEYCDDKQHCLSETVIQVGDIDDPGDSRCLMQCTRAAMERMQELGITIVAVDIHLDEATPHAHVLWAGITEKGEFNLDKTLAEHGVEKAAPERRVIAAKRGKTREETEKEYERRCTRLATFTAQVREAAEDASDVQLKAHGLPPLDRERSGKQNETLGEYRARMERIEQRARETAREDIYEDVKEELRPQVREIKQRDADSKARKARLDKREETLDEREKSLNAREQLAQQQANAAAALQLRCAERGEELDAREDELDEREKGIDKARAEAVTEGFEAGKAQGLAEGRTSCQRAQAGADAARRRYETALADLGDLDAKRKELEGIVGRLDGAKREFSEIAPALSEARRTVESADAYAREQRASADSYASGRRAEADAEADEVVRRTTKRWGAPLRFLGHMLSVAAQFCAQRALRDSGTAWAQRADVLRAASDVLYEIENHPRENVREAFERRMEQKLVEYDREQRAQSVTSVPVSYTHETPQRDDRQFGL